MISKLKLRKTPVFAPSCVLNKSYLSGVLLPVFLVVATAGLSAQTTKSCSSSFTVRCPQSTLPMCYSEGAGKWTGECLTLASAKNDQGQALEGKSLVDWMINETGGTDVPLQKDDYDRVLRGETIKLGDREISMQVPSTLGGEHFNDAPLDPNLNPLQPEEPVVNSREELLQQLQQLLNNPPNTLTPRQQELLQSEQRKMLKTPGYMPADGTLQRIEQIIQN